MNNAVFLWLTSSQSGGDRESCLGRPLIPLAKCYGGQKIITAVFIQCFVNDGVRIMQHLIPQQLRMGENVIFTLQMRKTC